ncbi:MAG TPA: TAT-variant-translocated molybdopterin oxidoreductase [Bryobacteraceae bacterium]|jgi:molybdopterin-containing oxidoreductase family iron-sulfur binding subunit|nr:TAT-variant-translocated molybdopterin oxidoreductase [Bryobacteraceae bacterium]
MSLISITGAKGSGRQYWRSLDQLADTPEFREWLHREFKDNATEMLEGESRRNVLKLMAASFGLAGLAACRRPVEHILPLSKGVEDYIPGQQRFYTSVMALNGDAAGILVEAHDGRPTKIEGNPDHPASQGAATALAQGALLNLYDPDRSKQVLANGKESSWKNFEEAVKALSLGDGTGLRFLSETVVSPTLAAQRAQALAKYPKAKWIEYESISRENERAGSTLAFGQAVDVLPQYDKAKVILSLDADFLGLDSTTPLPTRLFSKRRRFDTEEEMEHLSRLYIVESQFSLTGANADHRLRMRGTEVMQFAADVAAALGSVAGLNVMGGAGDKRAKFIAALVKDLKEAGKEALVVAGPRQPAMVHALAHAMNASLGSDAVSYAKPPAADKVETGVAAINGLAGEMNSGAVSTLVILGGNPAYTAPADAQFAAGMGKVAGSIYLGPEPNETAVVAKWHVPEAHFLETWGDARSKNGTVAIQQPLIEPLFGGKSAIEIMALLLGTKEQRAYDIVKAQYSAAGGEKAWKQALNDGIVASARPAEAAKATADAKKIGAAVAAEPKASDGGIEVAFVPSASSWDGTYANNGWMQEAPDPMTKLTWGNALMISPAMARKLAVRDGDVVELSRAGLKMEAAVMVQPGHADDAASIALGYGRTHCGRVGLNVGFNAGSIRTSDAFWYASGVTLAKTGKDHRHATTQEHGTLDDKGVNAEHLNNRPVYREVTVEEIKKHPKAVEEMSEIPELTSIYPEVKYDTGYQWGMAIDLGACTGCNACVVACVAENNTPVVGKDQVMRGREMHWIRMDRYYVGPEDDPRAVEQPIPCMQCENAPCENVCPVAATTHSPEGLNDMAYNRCVGTRYCANNCPFKVRHFNFLNFHKHDHELMSMAANPNVTVRMRGIMEKCTYCVQRIQEAKIKSKVEGRRGQIKDGEIQTACQQTCPAEAIVFGNINDPNSRVSKLKKQERNYAMLAELDIKPRTTYLAKVRNVNPELG